MRQQFQSFTSMRERAVAVYCNFDTVNGLFTHNIGYIVVKIW